MKNNRARIEIVFITRKPLDGALKCLSLRNNIVEDEWFGNNILQCVSISILSSFLVDSCIFC